MKNQYLWIIIGVVVLLVFGGNFITNSYLTGQNELVQTSKVCTFTQGDSSSATESYKANSDGFYSYAVHDTQYQPYPYLISSTCEYHGTLAIPSNYETVTVNMQSKINSGACSSYIRIYVNNGGNYVLIHNNPTTYNTLTGSSNNLQSYVTNGQLEFKVETQAQDCSGSDGKVAGAGLEYLYDTTTISSNPVQEASNFFNFASSNTQPTQKGLAQTGNPFQNMITNFSDSLQNFFKTLFGGL